MKSVKENSEFFPELQQLLVAERVTGRSGKVFEGLAAASTRNNLLLLRELFGYVKAKRTLEIGLGFGASALLLANCHRDRGVVANGQHVAIDPFQSTVWDNVAPQWLEMAELRDFVEILPDYSCTALAQLLATQQRFDLVYVDGSHLFEDVFVDTYFSSRLLEVGGVLAMDDCSDPHIAKVVRFLNKNSVHCLREFDLSHFRGKGLSRLAYRGARMLDRVQMRAFVKVGDANRVWNSGFERF